MQPLIKMSALLPPHTSSPQGWIGCWGRPTGYAVEQQVRHEQKGYGDHEQSSFSQLGTIYGGGGAPPPPFERLSQFSSGPLTNHKFSVVPLAPISLDQNFSSAPLAALKTQHHAGGGGGGLPPPPPKRSPDHGLSIAGEPRTACPMWSVPHEPLALDRCPLPTAHRALPHLRRLQSWPSPSSSAGAAHWEADQSGAEGGGQAQGMGKDVRLEAL